MPEYFEFYGIKVEIKGVDEVVNRIKKDFSYFRKSFCSDVNLKINFHSLPPDFSLIPEKSRAIFYHPEFVMYEKNNIQYIDYQGEGLSIYKKREREISIYSLNRDLLQEITYLTMLSLVGEDLERRNIYRVHGLSFIYREKGVLLLLPSGGGKTYLFLDLVESPEVRFLSDDLVLIDKKQRLLPFPLRLGLRERDRDRIRNIPSRFVYWLERRKYGRKILVDMKYFEDRIGAPTKLKFLFLGKRWNSSESKIEKANKFQVFTTLLKDLVIGVGLPQAVEYLNFGISFKKLTTLFWKLGKRIFFSLILTVKCKGFIILLGRKSEKNLSTLYNRISKQ